MNSTSYLKRNYIGLDVRHVNDDLNQDVQTVFEKFRPIPSFAIQSIITRGASATFRLATLDSHKILSRAADEICSNPGALFVVWLPKGDAVSHLHGPESEKLVSEMRNTSRGIGILTKKLKQAGLSRKARIIFTSDHGQKAVRFRVDLSRVFRRLGHSAIVNPHPFRRNPDVVICTSGESAAYVYLTAEKFPQEAKLELLTRLTNEEGIGLIFFRMDGRTHYILGKQGMAALSTRDDKEFTYAVLSGSDPLFITDREGPKHFDIHDQPGVVTGVKYPDILHQYLTSYVRGRSADVLLTASENYHFGVAPRLGWRLGFHRGSHGGPSAEEILFSAIVTGIDNHGQNERPIRSKDLLRLCLTEEANASSFDPLK